MPLGIIVSGRLAGDDGVFPNLLVRAFGRHLVDLVGSVRVTGELLVQCTTGKFTPVKARRLLRGVVAETGGHHLLAVGDAEVETVGRGLVAQLFPLKLHDLDDCLVHRTHHLVDWVFFLPSTLCAVVGEIGYVQSGGVLGIGTTEHIAIGIVTEEIGHVPADLGEIGDGTVVHEDMTAENKGVAVHLGHDAAAGGTDMGKQAVSLGIAAKVAEVEITDGW